MHGKGGGGRQLMWLSVFRNCIKCGLDQSIKLLVGRGDGGGKIINPAHHCTIIVTPYLSRVSICSAKPRPLATNTLKSYFKKTPTPLRSSISVTIKWFSGENAALTYQTRHNHKNVSDTCRHFNLTTSSAIDVISALMIHS